MKSYQREAEKAERRGDLDRWLSAFLAIDAVAPGGTSRICAPPSLPDTANHGVSTTDT